MASLNEVTTDELLSFQDYPTIHTTNTNSSLNEAQLKVDTSEQSSNAFSDFHNKPMNEGNFNIEPEETDSRAVKSIWTIEYYQQFFDVDSTDVFDRIVSSMLPRNDVTFKNQVKLKPDLYGPFWIAVTLVFTIAISGNIAKYFQHVNEQIQWKYNFHLVSYAATAIFFYITIIPVSLWALLKWNTNNINAEYLDEAPPKLLELICLYGYSLFIYIPVSILWTIQIDFLQWILVAVTACLSGSVLLFTINPHLKLSKHRLLLIIGIFSLHILLAIGFMLYFFHVPSTTVNVKISQTTVGGNITT